MRKTAAPTPHRKSRANISPFKRIPRCVSLSFPVLRCSSSSPYPRSLIRGTIRDTDPECLRSCWNFCDVGKRRGFRHQRMSCAPCRMSPLDEAVPPSCITPASRHVAIKEPVSSIQAFFAKGSNVHTSAVYSRARRMPRRPVYEIIRAHTAPLGGGIFLSGDRGAPSIRCKRGAKTLGRERGRQSFAHATHGNYRRRGC